MCKSVTKITTTRKVNGIQVSETTISYKGFESKEEAEKFLNSDLLLNFKLDFDEDFYEEEEDEEETEEEVTEEALENDGKDEEEPHNFKLGFGEEPNISPAQLSQAKANYAKASLADIEARIEILKKELGIE